jgi:hypothetical protein
MRRVAAAVAAGAPARRSPSGDAAHAAGPAGMPRHLDRPGLDHAFLAWGHFARAPREATRRVGEAIGRLLL